MNTCTELPAEFDGERVLVSGRTIAAAYVQSINDHDRATFDALFVTDAVVNDNGREFRGADTINAWSGHEIFDAQVTLETIETTDRDDETVITTKVDGNFDRTGLPDSLIMDHCITAQSGRIVHLTCQLAGG